MKILKLLEFPIYMLYVLAIGLTVSVFEFGRIMAKGVQVFFMSDAELNEYESIATR